jgi:hypothetical protein
MIPDKLLINLKIISKIQKNGRISRSYDGIISLESDVIYQSIKRFVLNDSRKQAIFEINSVITESIDMLNHIINSKHMNKNYSQTSEYIKNCENINLIITEMELAKLGIENLKFTYQNDHNTASQLDILILKINTTLKDIGQKLFYFQSFLTNQSTINKEPYQESYQDSYLRSIKIETDVNQSQEDPYLNMENI